METKASVTVAVIPAAGFGTRFLPATKSIPKEMLPIVKRPAIQVIAEEAHASGITDFVVVTGRNKGEIVDHFDRAPELEAALEKSGKDELLRSVVEPVHLMDVSCIRQHKPRGLGHAVLRARALVGDKSFVVLLPDDLIQADEPFLKTLIEVHERTGKAALALMEVPESAVSSYGIVDGHYLEDGTFNIVDMVEKPSPEDAPSRLAVVGRYVLPGKIFNILENTTPGSGSEIQLTDALKVLAREDGIIGVPLEGTRHDTGNVLGYIMANIAYGLETEGLGDELREAMEKVLKER